MKSKIEVAQEIAPDNSAVVLAMANAHEQTIDQLQQTIDARIQINRLDAEIDLLTELKKWIDAKLIELKSKVGEL